MLLSHVEYCTKGMSVWCLCWCLCAFPPSPGPRSCPLRRERSPSPHVHAFLRHTRHDDMSALLIEGNEEEGRYMGYSARSAKEARQGMRLLVIDSNAAAVRRLGCAALSMMSD